MKDRNKGISSDFEKMQIAKKEAFEKKLVEIFGIFQFGDLMQKAIEQNVFMGTAKLGEIEITEINSPEEGKQIMIVQKLSLGTEREETRIRDVKKFLITKKVKETETVFYENNSIRAVLICNCKQDANLNFAPIEKFNFGISYSVRSIDRHIPDLINRDRKRIDGLFVVRKDNAFDYVNINSNKLETISIPDMQVGVVNTVLNILKFDEEIYYPGKINEVSRLELKKFMFYIAAQRNAKVTNQGQAF